MASIWDLNVDDHHNANGDDDKGGAPKKVTCHLGDEGGECQSLSVTFTLRTSLLDVLGRPYMMSCKIFKVF